MSSKDARGDKGASTGKRIGGNKKMSGAKLSTGSKGTGGGKKAAGRPHRGGKTKSQASSRQRTGRPSHRGASFDASALEGGVHQVSNVALLLDAGLEAREQGKSPTILSHFRLRQITAPPRPQPPPHPRRVPMRRASRALPSPPRLGSHEDVCRFPCEAASVDARKKSNVHFDVTYAVHLAQGIIFPNTTPLAGQIFARTTRLRRLRFPICARSRHRRMGASWSQERARRGCSAHCSWRKRGCARRGRARGRS